MARRVANQAFLLYWLVGATGTDKTSLKGTLIRPSRLRFVAVSRYPLRSTSIAAGVTIRVDLWCFRERSSLSPVTRNSASPASASASRYHKDPFDREWSSSHRKDVAGSVRYLYRMVPSGNPA